MKKRLLLLPILLILTFSVISAYELSKTEKSTTVIAELGNPAIYDFAISGGTQDDYMEIYSLVGIRFDPQAAFDLSGSKTLEVKAYPSKKYLDRPGNYLAEFYIRGSQGQLKDELLFRVVSLKDTISLIPNNLHPDDDSLQLTIQNTQNAILDDMTLTFTSDFFKAQKKISLGAFEQVNITIPVDKENTRSLVAGRYIMNAQVSLDEANVKVEGVINYLEKQGTSIETSTDGFLVRKTTIAKKNEGNVPVVDTITLNKDIVSRLFTTYSLDPENAKRSGVVVGYSWSKTLQPNESWVVISTTNYTFPFILILLIIVVASLVHIYSTTHLGISKQVSYVKTKNGEFALKVRVSVKARKHVERIQVIDRLPGMTKLYEKFGIKPDKIEASSRRLFWNIDRLQAGEERVFSYIIYSNVNIVGRFELPSATAIYEKDGKTHETLSNRAFFLSDISSAE